MYHCQKLCKSTQDRQSYCKNKNGAVFLKHSVEFIDFTNITEQTDKKLFQSILFDHYYCFLTTLPSTISSVLGWYQNTIVTETNSSLVVTVLKFGDFFEWNPATQTRGHDFKLYKRNCVHRSRAVFFSERVINVWDNCLSQLILDRYLCSWRIKIMMMMIMKIFPTTP